MTAMTVTESYETSASILFLTSEEHRQDGNGVLSRRVGGRLSKDRQQTHFPSHPSSDVNLRCVFWSLRRSKQSLEFSLHLRFPT